MNFEAMLPWLVGVGGGGGLLALVKAIMEVVGKVRAGVSAREGKRRVDLVEQRDAAVLKAQLAEERANRYRDERDVADQVALASRRNEQRAREHAAELRIELMERAGMRREELPPWPEMEDTIPRSALPNRKDDQ